jgi:hypothetical protein
MKKIAIFMAFIVLLMSCTVDNESDLLFDLKTFGTEQQLWLEQDLSNYSFYLTFDYSLGRYWRGTVVVKEGTLFGFMSDDVWYNPDEPTQITEQWINTISGIFDSIEEKGSNQRCELEYDNEFHFPKRYIYGSHRFTITKFNPNAEIEHNTLNFDRETLEHQRQLWTDGPAYSFRLRYDSLEDRGVQGPIMRNLWEGTVLVHGNGSYKLFSINPPTYYAGDSQDWTKPIPDIFDRIVQDSEKNYGLVWGRKSQSTLEVEYDSEYHFPTRYRYHAEPVEPAGQEGTQRLYEITITDFTRFG